MRIEKKVVSLKNQNLRVWSILPREEIGLPLVCLHEGLGCLELWRNFPQILAEQTKRAVYLLERHGHGQSGVIPGHIDGEYQTREAEDILPLLLDVLGFEKIDLLGHSDGGTIALLFAGFAPWRVEKVVTMAAHAYNDSISVHGILQAIQDYEKGNLREKMWRYHGEATDGLFGRWSRTWTDPSFKDWNILYQLEAVKCHVLAMQGAQDEYGETQQIEKICQAVSGPSQNWLIPDCGHNPHFDQPQRVITKIKEFLK